MLRADATERGPGPFTLCTMWAVLPLTTAVRGPGGVVRAAARSGVVVLCMSGVNATVTLEALLLPGLWDTQCGFKLFRGDLARAVFAELQTDGFGFDVELLLLARRRGYRVAEVAINWADQPGSKVAVWKDGPRMVAQILAARRRLAKSGRGRR